jgi:hypothetical protein
MAQQIPSEARKDYDALLEALLPFAEQMLKDHDEFYPMGMAINAQGEVVAHSTQDQREMPPAAEVLSSLVSAFRDEAMRGAIRAAGICSNGRIETGGKPTDAIIVTLERMGGEACRACVPYKKKIFGSYSFGNLVVGKADPRIFV